jgi:hypothetical protein
MTTNSAGLTSPRHNFVAAPLRGEVKLTDRAKSEHGVNERRDKPSWVSQVDWDRVQEIAAGTLAAERAKREAKLTAKQKKSPSPAADADYWWKRFDR